MCRNIFLFAMVSNTCWFLLSIFYPSSSYTFMVDYFYSMLLAVICLRSITSLLILIHNNPFTNSCLFNVSFTGLLSSSTVAVEYYIGIWFWGDIKMEGWHMLVALRVDMLVVREGVCLVRFSENITILDYVDRLFFFLNQCFNFLYGLVISILLLFL